MIPVKFPESGMSKTEFTESVKRAYEKSLLGRPERIFSGESPHMLPDGRRQLAIEAFMKFIDANVCFFTGESARQMERDLISMMGSLLGNEDAVGNITTGGTESNVLALLAARNRAGTRGSVVLPKTAHESLFKACDYLGLEPISVDPKADWTADVEKMEKAVRKDTIAIVGTPGTWVYSSIDPIEEIGEIAEERDLYFHLDAAIGGLLLPFLERSGQKLPKYDFRVKSVCSISADPHKNGMTPLSAGAIIFRDTDLHNFSKFKIRGKTGTVMKSYQTETLIGSRPGSPIVGAWAMFNLIGADGYVAIAKKVMEITYAFRDGFKEIPGLKLFAEPKVNVVSAYSDQYGLHNVTEELRQKGWVFFTLDVPSGLVLWLDPVNDGQAEPFLADLKQAMRLKIPV